MKPISRQPRVYIASPFFNPYEVSIIEQIKDVCAKNALTFFSPKDDMLYNPDTMKPADVLQVNIDALYSTDLTVCVTDGKDPGTLFEAGWCYAQGIPIIYIWLTGKKDQKFNLVLAASGAVVRSIEQLDRAIKEIKQSGAFEHKVWDDKEIRYE